MFSGDVTEERVHLVAVVGSSVASRATEIASDAANAGDDVLDEGTEETRAWTSTAGGLPDGSGGGSPGGA